MAMSLEEVGAYWKLVSICWLEEGLPSELPVLARLLHVTPAKMARLWPAIEPCFRLESGTYQHPRLDREREKQDEYRRKQSVKGRKSAEARFNHGSTTVQPEGNREATGGQPEGNSSSSSSSSSASAKRESEPAASVTPFRRGAGPLGGSYLSQSTAVAASAWTHHKGFTLSPGRYYSKLLANFDGNVPDLHAWMDRKVDEHLAAGGKVGDLFKFFDAALDADFGLKVTQRDRAMNEDF